MTKKRLLLGAVPLACVGATVAILAWPKGKPMFLETAKGRYQVISARYIYSTNLAFSADTPAELWGRRQLDRVGIHLKGDRRADSGFIRGIGIHAIAVLCKGQVPDENLMQVDAECITEAGQTVRLNTRLLRRGSHDRVYIVFTETDAEIKDLYSDGLADAPVTNFSPRTLRIFRKSDHHELTRLDLSH
jgi:hypothetical protein